MELAIYIKKLLYNRDILIIPGLGGLLTKYRPAEIDISNNIITPPTKFLTFDQQLSMKDRTLVDYIAAQKKISISEAEVFVADEVSSLIQKLENGGTVMMEGIGYFSKDGEHIRFDHEQNVNFLTESFGLANVDYKSVEFKLTPQPIPETYPVYNKRNKSLLYVLLGIFIFGGAAATYLFYPEIIQLIKKKYQKETTVIPVIAPPKADTVAVVNKKIENQIAADTAKHVNVEKIIDVNTEKKNALAIKKVEKVVPTTVRTKENFFIIAGSFKTKRQSEVLANILIKQGLNAEVMQFAPDLFRVSLGKFQNRAEAIAELEKVKSIKGQETVWLLAK